MLHRFSHILISAFGSNSGRVWRSARVRVPKFILSPKMLLAAFSFSELSPSKDPSTKCFLSLIQNKTVLEII
jgi:hypothetical protein